MGKEIADRYLLKTTVGEGRFGRVFKAKDYKTSKKVALKLVHKFDVNEHLVSDLIEKLLRKRD